MNKSDGPQMPAVPQDQQERWDWKKGQLPED